MVNKLHGQHSHELDVLNLSHQHVHCFFFADFSAHFVHVVRRVWLQPCTSTSSTSYLQSESLAGCTGHCVAVRSIHSVDVDRNNMLLHGFFFTVVALECVHGRHSSDIWGLVDNDAHSRSVADFHHVLVISSFQVYRMKSSCWNCFHGLAVLFVCEVP